MTDKEILTASHKKLYRLSQLLEQGVITLDDIASFVPGIMHTNKRENLELTFLSETGCNYIRYSMEEINTMGAEIFSKHQSKFTLEKTYPKLLQKMKEDDKDRIVPFFQDWKIKKDDTPFFYLTSTKILNENEFISVSLAPNKVEYLSNKVNDIFETNTIFNKYFTRYHRLTKREKEIIKLLAMEMTRKEISYQLFIDETTVKKHCENIYKKLETSKRIDIERIARTFSMII